MYVVKVEIFYKDGLRSICINHRAMEGTAILEDKPVEKEKIMQILKAGMQAPSACNQQPWEFYNRTRQLEGAARRNCRAG